jgi:hypothetical protein
MIWRRLTKIAVRGSSITRMILNDFGAGPDSVRHRIIRRFEGITSIHEVFVELLMEHEILGAQGDV